MKLAAIVLIFASICYASPTKDCLPTPSVAYGSTMPMASHSTMSGGDMSMGPMTPGSPSKHGDMSMPMTPGSKNMTGMHGDMSMDGMHGDMDMSNMPMGDTDENGVSFKDVSKLGLKATSGGTMLVQEMSKFSEYNHDILKTLPKDCPLVYVCIKTECGEACVGNNKPNQVNDVRNALVTKLTQDVVNYLKQGYPTITTKDVKITNLLKVDNVTGAEIAFLNMFGSTSDKIVLEMRLKFAESAPGNYAFDPSVFATVPNALGSTSIGPSVTASSSKGLPVGGIVGIVAGVACVALVAGLFVGLRHRKAKRKQQTMQTNTLRKEKLSEMWFNNEEDKASARFHSGVVENDNLEGAFGTVSMSASAMQSAMQSSRQTTADSFHTRAQSRVSEDPLENGDYFDPKLIAKMRESVYDFGDEEPQY